MFDLPVMTAEERRDATRFRKFLLAEGMFRMQYSVYARYCDNSRLGETIAHHIKGGLPTNGEIRILFVTDKQFSDMRIYENAKKKKTEAQPDQLLLF